MTTGPNSAVEDSGPSREPGAPDGGGRSVRRVVLMGVFWRILIIEAVLLAWSLLYRLWMDDPALDDLLWYALRIILLIVIILLFMMISLRSFLERRIILPLEAIAAANRRREPDEGAGPMEPDTMPPGTPTEILEIVQTRTAMLSKILTVSRERLRLVGFIRETFGRYLSRQIVDEILESPEKRRLGGRRATVTILMSDLRGYTSRSETSDPEQLVQLLNRYLDRMSRIIVGYDGLIDEIIGDSILAIFGVPEPLPDDCWRAVACAIAMQNAMAGLNVEIAAEGHPPLEMGIGVNTGPVVVGNIGSELRMKYGIVGAAVNIASRIESSSTGGQVLLSESSWALVRDVVHAEPPQTLMMKGLAQPLVSYPAVSIGEPYNLELQIPPPQGPGVPMKLSFRCWKVEGKQIDPVEIGGETSAVDDNRLSAVLSTVQEPLADLKIQFDFCVEAHCFGDIYAKVLAVDTSRSPAVHQLTITSISAADRDILKQWMAEGA